MSASIRKRNLRPELIPAILSLAAPTMLEELVDTAVQYIDIAMVGSLGTAATAAVGATATINWLIGGTFSALGIGFLSYIAKSRGAGNDENAARASAQAVFLALFTGILFSAIVLPLSSYVPGWMHADVSIRPLAARYFLILYSSMVFRSARIIFGTILRASGDTRTPMRVGLLVNLLNVAGNFFLIYPTREIPSIGGMRIPGAGLGVEGAALASAASVAVGGMLITIALWRHRSVSPRGYSLIPDPEILRPCLKISLPNMLQRFCTSLGYVVFASMINSLAHHCKHGGISLLYPGIRDDGRCRHSYGQLHRCGRQGEAARSCKDDTYNRDISDGDHRRPASYLCPCNDGHFLAGRCSYPSREHGAPHGGGVRAVLRSIHRYGRNAPGRRAHVPPVPLQPYRNVGGAHNRYGDLYPPGLRPCFGLVLHDSPQHAPAHNAEDLLPEDLFSRSRPFSRLNCSC